MYMAAMIFLSLHITLRYIIVYPLHNQLMIFLCLIIYLYMYIYISQYMRYTGRTCIRISFCSTKFKSWLTPPDNGYNPSI